MIVSRITTERSATATRVASPCSVTRPPAVRVLEAPREAVTGCCTNATPVRTLAEVIAAAAFLEARGTTTRLLEAMKATVADLVLTPAALRVEDALNTAVAGRVM